MSCLYNNIAYLPRFLQVNILEEVEQHLMKVASAFVGRTLKKINHEAKEPDDEHL